MNEKLVVEISKCLSNPIRLTILNWLKDPENNFPSHNTVKHFNDGVCASYIHAKTNLSQSTVSTYLSLMEKCGLLISTRHGKWSYFKRNELLIEQYMLYFK